MIILLDTSVLGSATNPAASEETRECKSWLVDLIKNGCNVLIPEIADYELRRELLRADKTRGLKALDELIENLEYLPINTNMMRKASEYWAECRNKGKPFDEDKALDGDVILCAQANSVSNQGSDVVVATTNIGHLSLFVVAKKWQEIA
ncbi:MAG TPA: type II toxin-antitoxin system VapC family toxin [Nitrospirae bacterium]|nr:type II toxin-antitoxin system VapC family toxin [Nitrospirota bacterium]